MEARLNSSRCAQSRAERTSHVHPPSRRVLEKHSRHVSFRLPAYCAALPLGQVLEVQKPSLEEVTIAQSQKKLSVLLTSNEVRRLPRSFDEGGL